MIRKRKDKTRLWFEKEIPMNSTSSIHVFIWEDRKAMHRNANQDNPDVQAVFLPAPFELKDSGPVIPKPIGEIHLVRGDFGAGVFAHELQHAMLHMAHLLQYDSLAGDDAKTEEAICHVTGDVTARFWSAFYEFEATLY